MIDASSARSDWGRILKRKPLLRAANAFKGFCNRELMDFHRANDHRMVLLYQRMDFAAFKFAADSRRISGQVLAFMPIFRGKSVIDLPGMPVRGYQLSFE